MGELFADWNKTSGKFKPWKSEEALETLKMETRIEKT